jgi:hypothetical protein
LADVLARLQRESGLAARLGERALANARLHHSSEHRVAQILAWIDTGLTPRHWD